MEKSLTIDDGRPEHSWVFIVRGDVKVATVWGNGGGKDAARKEAQQIIDALNRPTTTEREE